MVDETKLQLATRITVLEKRVKDLEGHVEAHCHNQAVIVRVLDRVKQMTNVLVAKDMCTTGVMSEPEFKLVLEKAIGSLINELAGPVAPEPGEPIQ